LLLPSLRRRVVWKRLAGALAVLVGVAVAASVLSGVLVGRESHGYDEMTLKRTALSYAGSAEHLFTVRSLFTFPLPFGLSSTQAPDAIFPSEEIAAQLREQWQYDTWLFLTAGAMAVLGLVGSLRDRQFAFYQLLLWLVGGCWNAGMLAV